MTRHEPIDAASELKANVAVPFERARAMPRSVYTSDAFLKREMEEIFAREWYCVGRADQFAKPGDYVATELAGRPIFVVRDKEGALRGFSNVCRHRMSTLLEGTGNTGSIVCPYHAWTYGLDGKLRGAPGMAQNEAFRREEICLPAVRCAEWLGWVLVTLNPDAPEPAEQLSEVEALIGDFGMERYQQTFQEEWRWNTNWKVLAENFMESYHLPVCHGPTIGSFVKLEEMECPPGLPAFNYHWILKDPNFFLSVAHPTNTSLKGERRRMTYLITVYPSLLITLTPGYFWYLSLHPDGVDHVRILYGGGLAPEFVADPAAAEHFANTKKLLDEVNEEDKHCTQRVYQGLCSDLAEPGPLSHLERPNWDFARWISERLG